MPSLPILAQHCAVILLNYNRHDETLACLHALSDLCIQPQQVLVVDNSSRSEDVHALREGWQKMNRQQGLPLPHEVDEHCAVLLPGEGLLCLPRNRGFSSGNNAGLRLLLARTSCSAFWLLNNDTLPHASALDALCTRLRQRPDAGLCGSTLIYTHAPERVQALGGCTLSPYTGRTAFVGHGMPLEAVRLQNVEQVEQRTDFVVGASVLVRREVLEQAGLMPEEYFLYYEDAAFALAARRKGFGLAWARESIVLHKEGASTGAQGGQQGEIPVRSPLMDYLGIRNRIWLIRRVFPWAMPMALLSLAGVALNRLRRGQKERLPLLLRAVWDALRGRMGVPHNVP